MLNIAYGTFKGNIKIVSRLAVPCLSQNIENNNGDVNY